MCALQGHCGSEVKFVKHQCVLRLSRYVGSREEFQVSRLVLQVLCSVSRLPGLVSVYLCSKEMCKVFADLGSLESPRPRTLLVSVSLRR